MAIRGSEKIASACDAEALKLAARYTAILSTRGNRVTDIPARFSTTHTPGSVSSVGYRLVLGEPEQILTKKRGSAETCRHELHL